VGLLYTISQALTELELDIVGAKICTERGAAIDSFYVRELDGRRVEDPKRQHVIEVGLKRALARLEAG